MMANPRRFTSALIFLSLILAAPAMADVKAVTVAPAVPTECDPVTITAAGELSSYCYEIVSATIQGPDRPPCLPPIPCPASFQVEITVRQPSPGVCIGISKPYTRSFEVGTLPPGEYRVTAHERVIPYDSDSTVSENFVTRSFTVGPESPCPAGCYLLDFVPDRVRDPSPATSCTATAPMGGIACLQLSLGNRVAVGGLQTTLHVAGLGGIDPSRPESIHPISVEAVQRVEGFQVGWTADGSSTKIILYPATPGATIPAGNGPVIRICYQIGASLEAVFPPVFRVTETQTIVADPIGEAIPPCPTMRFAAPMGTICVANGLGCDINYDGVADVLDVIRIVRCALANDSTACPDSITARADCNRDGSLDVRDVICCVRKIVEFAIPRIGTWGSGSARTEAIAVGTGTGNAIGFDGGIQWTSQVEGRAIVRLDTGDDWGGTEFAIDPSLAPVRIRALRLVDASSTEQLEWAVHSDGVAHAMFFSATPGSRPARSYRVEVLLERTQSSQPGTMVLTDMKGGSSTGAPVGLDVFQTGLLVIPAQAPAPALLGARPNPSAGQTDIAFVLPVGARVKLNVYDVAGRLVRKLIDGPMPAGVQSARWDGKDGRGRTARSGVYFTKLEVGATVRSERFLLLR